MELSPEILKKIRSIELRAGHLVDDAFAGGYLSTFKGQGMEWEDVRHYVPGDDVRRIDWKVTARLGETQIKQFREEREIVIYVLIDVSASGQFGSVDVLRSERLAELAAALAFCTTKNNDKIGVLFFSDHVERHIPPGSGQSHIFKVIREILAHEGNKVPANKETKLLPAVERLCKIRKKRTIVFVLSDFFMNDLPLALEQLARRHQVCLFWLVDDLEKQLPAASLLPVQDAETGTKIWVDLSLGRAREIFQKLALDRKKALESEARKRKTPLVCLENNATYIDQVVHFFRSRMKFSGARS